MLTETEAHNIQNILRQRFRKKNPESRFPWINVYEWKGEIITSTSYQSDSEAFLNADQSYFVDYKPYYYKPRRIANASENDVKYIGCFDVTTGNLQARTPRI